MYRKYTKYSVLVQPCLLQKDRKKCALISNIVIVQCIAVFIGSTTILQCVWSPESAMADFQKLARIMYLYDSQACGYRLKKAKSMTNLQFNNKTYGLDILPIKWKPAISTVSTRLSAITRMYINLSLAIHVLWMLLAIGLRIFTRSSTEIRIIKCVLNVFLFACISVIIFDLSMAIVYIAHIKQCLTKSMILRYSGWSVKLKLQSYDEFGGWLPIIASICWMRGVIILALNIYCCKVIQFTKKKIRTREVTKKILRAENQPIPDPIQMSPTSNMLIYRTGERKPYAKQEFSHIF